MFVILKSVNNNKPVIYDEAETYDKAIAAINWDDDYGSLNAVKLSDNILTTETLKGKIVYQIVEMSDGTLQENEYEVEETEKIVESETPLGELSVSINNREQDKSVVSVSIFKDGKTYALSEVLIDKNEIKLNRFKDPVKNPKDYSSHDFVELVNELKKVHFSTKDISDIYAFVARADIYGKWSSHMPSVDYTWWTCTEGEKERQMLYMGSIQEPTGEYDTKSHGIRPAINFRCENADDLEIETTLVLNGHSFKIVEVFNGVVTAVSDTAIAKIPYGENHNYDTSVPKLVVDGWLFGLMKGEKILVNDIV